MFVSTHRHIALGWLNVVPAGLRFEIPPFITLVGSLVTLRLMRSAILEQLLLVRRHLCKSKTCVLIQILYTNGGVEPCSKRSTCAHSTMKIAVTISHCANPVKRRGVPNRAAEGMRRAASRTLHWLPPDFRVERRAVVGLQIGSPSQPRVSTPGITVFLRSKTFLLLFFVSLTTST